MVSTPEAKQILASLVVYTNCEAIFTFSEATFVYIFIKLFLDHFVPSKPFHGANDLYTLFPFGLTEFYSSFHCNPWSFSLETNILDRLGWITSRPWACRNCFICFMFYTEPVEMMDQCVLPFVSLCRTCLGFEKYDCYQVGF